MLDVIATNADPIFGAMNFVFIISLLPTIWHQWRVKASTVPLHTSTLTAASLVVIFTVFFSLGMWLTFATDVVISTLWATIAAQCFVYGGTEEN